MVRLKHIFLDGQVYFVTAVTHRRQKIFDKPPFARKLLTILYDLKKQEKFLLFAFIIMPDHLHILLKPEDPLLSKLMQKIKGRSAWHINRLRQRNGKVWQDGYYEHGIRNEKDFWEKYNYIFYNAVKAGLVEKPEDFFFSSAHPTNPVDGI